jgi:predicted Zn-dependent protease
VICAALIPLAAACTAVNPATGEKQFMLMSPEDEARIGKAEHSKVLKQFGGVYDDPNIGGYVAQIGGRLVANSELAGQPFTFTVLNSPVVNAFALPGGYVYVTRGLVALANNEAELAGVIAHEIGHVTARHSAQRMTQATVVGLGGAILGAALGVPQEVTNLGSQLYLTSFSRDQEYEADLLGVRYLTRVGYDPYAQADFLESLGAHTEMMAKLSGNGDRPPEFLSTHPNTPERVIRAANAAKASGAGPSAPNRRQNFLNTIDGLVYGDDPEQGFVRGRVFSHPKLRFTFTVPEGFQLINRPDAVLAKGPSSSGIVFNIAEPKSNGDPLGYMVHEWAKSVRLADVERIKINGLDAATGWTRLNVRGSLIDVRLVVIRFSGRQLFRFQFITPTNMTARLSQDLQRTTYSFRRLSSREAAALKPLRIRIVTVRAGDTAQSLARRMAVDDAHLERFQVLNRLKPGQNPPVGSRIKLVEG